MSAPGRLRRCLCAVFCAAFLLPACHADPKDQGVAARVNGRPITVRSVEFVRGLSLYSPPMKAEDALAHLKSEYGGALASLIVEELVQQELARLGMEVSDADLVTAETAARAGYAGNAFEEALAEEGIDLASWRDRLRGRLALDALAQRVLRPRVTLSPEEIQNYYKLTSKEFVQPARVKFLRVESKSQEILRSALEAASKANDPAGVLGVFDEVHVQAQAMDEETLPAQWRNALGKLKPGEACAPFQGGLGWQALILLERGEARTAGLAQVYAIVEKRLAEAKLEKEFTLWLAQAVTASSIEINPALIDPKDAR